MPAQADTLSHFLLRNALQFGRFLTHRPLFMLGSLLLTLGGQCAWAAEYAIQVGAFKNPSQAFADEVRQFGEVNTAQNSNGITVFTVGRYDSIDSAQSNLDQVQARYPGAFVRNMPSSASNAGSNLRPQASEATAAATKKVEQAVASNTTPEAKLWESLTDSERRRVVYLDGILHLKQGDNFVPLTDYRRSQAQ